MIQVICQHCGSSAQLLLGQRCQYIRACGLTFADGTDFLHEQTPVVCHSLLQVRRPSVTGLSAAPGTGMICTNELVQNVYHCLNDQGPNGLS